MNTGMSFFFQCSNRKFRLELCLFPNFCRHVILPADKAKSLPKPPRLLTEDEWRALGVQQSRGWEHYAIHKPEPHVLLFRRLLSESPNPPSTVVTSKASLVQTQQQQMLM